MGILFGGARAEFPAFTGWTWTSPGGDTASLFPVLFVTGHAREEAVRKDLDSAATLVGRQGDSTSSRK